MHVDWQRANNLIEEADWQSLIMRLQDIRWSVLCSKRLCNLANFIARKLCKKYWTRVKPPTVF